MSTTTDTISDWGQWDDAMDMNISDQELVEAYNIMMITEDKNEKNNTSEHAENKDIEMMTFDMLMDDVECL